MQPPRATSSPAECWGDQLNAGGNDGGDCSQRLRELRERQDQEIEKAINAGKYQGHPIEVGLHKRVSELLTRVWHTSEDTAREMLNDNGFKDKPPQKNPLWFSIVDNIYRTHSGL